MRALTRKGEVTILEHVGGKTIVRAASGSILTLEGGEKERLIAELCQICKNWPDT